MDTKLDKLLRHIREVSFEKTAKGIFVTAVCNRALYEGN
jgi:hypothetical protein